MAKVTVKLFSKLRKHTGKSEIEIRGTDLREAMKSLAKEYGGLGELIFDNEELHSFINVMVNGINIKNKDGLDTVLNDGDVIAVFPPISGG